MSLFRLSSLALVVAAALLAPPADAQYKEVTRRLPNSANTILLLNVEQAHASSLGVKEGWREDHEKQFAAGLVIVPPQARTFVMAAQMDFDTMQPKWQVAMMELKYEAELTKAAARLNGTVDNIAGRDVAVLPGDICVIKFGTRWAGIRHPAIRQEVARWINAMDENTTGNLSPYMDAAVKFAEEGAPLIMAMDLTHVLSAGQIRPQLETMESLQGHDVDLDALAKVLASVEGISLGVTIGEKRFGKIKIDFSENVSITRDFAKPLLLEVLGNRGAMIDEFATWQAKVYPNQITLEGYLYQSGTRRILSVLDAPPALQQEAQASTQVDPDDPQQQQKLMQVASQQYFNSVTSLLDDLRYKRQETDRYVSWNQVGTWFEKYARKIDRLPILNVDQDLVQYGAWVADSLRQAENALKGIAPATRSRQTEVPNYVNVRTYGAPIGVTRGGAYGWGGWTATEDFARRGQEFSKIRTQERIKGNMSANSIVQHIEAATADMRRHLTQKYQVEF